MDFAKKGSCFRAEVSPYCLDEVLKELDPLFSSIDDRRMLSALEDKNKVTRKPFVLLVNSASERYNPAIWRFYVSHYHDRLRKEYYARFGCMPGGLDGPELDQEDLTPLLGNVIIRTQHIVWVEHDMVLVVDTLPSRQHGMGLQRVTPLCDVAWPHITLESLERALMRV